jgi:prepilin-type N-terminal cleavage/methylation domain-containing protein
MMSKQSHHRFRGFTLAELLLGLAVTAIVLTALATFTIALAQNWTSQDGTQQLQVQSDQIYQRLRFNLASAKYIAQVQAGSLDGSATTPGSVYYWAVDDWQGVSDEAPEVGEMALIQHDPTTGTLWLYQPIAYSAMTTAQQTNAATTLTHANLIDPTWPATFKALDYVTATALGTSVTGALFTVNWMSSTTQRPVVECTLVLNRGTQTQATQYGSVTLRAPYTQPSP